MLMLMLIMMMVVMLMGVGSAGAHELHVASSVSGTRVEHVH
jgi:hypothetical protein